MMAEPAGTAARLRAGVHGIRGRVVLTYVALLAAALLAVILVGHGILVARLDRQIDDALVQEVEELRRLSDGNDPGTGRPFGTDAGALFEAFLTSNVPLPGEAFFTITGGGEIRTSFDPPADLAGDASRVDRWLALRGSTAAEEDSRAGPVRTLAAPVLDDAGSTLGVFVVAFFPRELQREIDRVVATTLLVSLVVLVASSAAAAALAGRVVRPVRDLTDTAAQITGEDLTSRFQPDGEDELARLGTTLNSMLDRLEAGFADQRAVLDDVAHELRTPITVVRGHLELLDEDPEERRATVELCLDELDRMARYVEDLLLVAKAKQPAFLRPAPVDLGELGPGLLERLRPLAPRRWSLDASPPPGSLVVADEQRLTQAVVNLAANAVEHTREDGRIGISVVRTGGWLRLAVSDDGTGFDDEAVERSFQRFSRGAGSRSARPDGTGLGLAIVRAIAEAHGGRVELETERGRGSTVALVVPAPDPEEDPT